MVNDRTTTVFWQDRASARKSMNPAWVMRAHPDWPPKIC